MNRWSPFWASRGVEAVGKGKNNLQKAFGLDECGCVCPPEKLSNVKVARIEHGKERACVHCFPHGGETTNATLRKNTRCWKRQRKTRYKVKNVWRRSNASAACGGGRSITSQTLGLLEAFPMTYRTPRSRSGVYPRLLVLLSNRLEQKKRR